MTSLTPLQQWHEIVATRDLKLLEELLAEEVVFYSPVVWTPQKGKMLTTLYLMGAMQVLASETSNFTYLKEIVHGRHAVLEFITKIDDITVNGIDMIEWNEDGKIINFKVMIRPLKAIHKVHEKMQAMLEKFKS